MLNDRIADWCAMVMSLTALAVRDQNLGTAKYAVRDAVPTASEVRVGQSPASGAHFYGE